MNSTVYTIERVLFSVFRAPWENLAPLSPIPSPSSVDMTLRERGGRGGGGEGERQRERGRKGGRHFQFMTALHQELGYMYIIAIVC